MAYFKFVKGKNQANKVARDFRRHFGMKRVRVTKMRGDYYKVVGY